MAGEPDVFLPDQFSNPANPAVHRRTTGPEIERALDGRVDVLVAGVGTGGTITGVGEYLRERNPELQIVAVEPSGSAVLSGGAPGPHRIQGIGAGFVPAVLNRELLDEVIPVSDDDAIQTAWACARRAGLLAGHLLRRRAVGRAAGGRAPGVARASGLWSIMPDSGERYVSPALLRSLSTRRRSERYAVARMPRPRQLSLCAGRERAASRHGRRSRSRSRGSGRGAGGDLPTWPGIHALLAHRVAHALHDVGRAAAAAHDLDAHARADRDRDPSRGADR